MSFTRKKTTDDNELSDAQRAMVFQVLQKFSIIDVKPQTKQWKLMHEFRTILESNFIEHDTFDSVRFAVRVFTGTASDEERSVISSFVLDYVVTTYSHLQPPRGVTPDVKNSKEVINYLMEELRNQQK